MYCDFFGLQALPFNNTPDPRFFFNTPDHEEALASLLYAAEERKGFVLVTGEVGSGKTLLSRLLLNELGSGTCTAVINNTRLTGQELLQAICHEFEIEIDQGAAVAELSRLLEKFLLEQYARDRLAVVILDEAQNLPMESFEELRMLGNLEADDAKLLQVLILGQPELQEAFRSSAMRQLHQRMFRTFHLRALSRELTAGYIRHRLQIGGRAEGPEIFAADALDAIYHHSEGIPRLINQICDNALLAAYSESNEQVTAKIINEVVEQMMALTVVQNPPPRRALARQFLDVSAPGEAALEDADVRLAPPPAEVGNADSNLQDRLQDIDHLMQRMADRLEASELALNDMQPEDRTTGEQSGQAAAELGAVREMRQEAAEVLRQVSSSSQDAQQRVRDLLQQTRQSAERLYQQAEQVLTEAKSNTAEVGQDLRGVLEDARRASERVEKQAAGTLTEAQKQNAILHEQVKKLSEEVRARAKAQQHRASELTAQEQADLEEARRMRAQAACQLEEVSVATQEANQRMDALLEKAELASRQVEERAEDALGGAEEQIAVLQTQEKRLFQEVHAYAAGQRERISELLSQQREELEAVRQMRLKVAETLAEGEKQGVAVREQAKRLLDETRQHAEAHGTSVKEAIAREQARFEAARSQANELAAQMKERATEADRQSSEMLGYVQTQAQKMSDRLDELSELAKTRTEEANSALETFTTQMRNRIAEAQQQLADAISKSHAEAHDARQLLSATKEQLIAEAQTGHSKADEILEECADLLVKTRGQTSSLLTGLRLQISEQTEQIEKIWHSAIAEGSKTLSELQAELNQTRHLTEQSRTELQRLVQSATGELSETRRVFEEGLSSHRAEIAALSDNAETVKAEVVRRFDDARKGLEDAAETHHHNLRQRLLELISETEGHATSAEARSRKTIESLQDEHISASETADRIHTELQQSVALLEEAETRVDTMSGRADETSRGLADKIDELRQAAKAGVAHVRQELDACLREAADKVQKIRHDSEAVAAGLAARMEQTQTRAETAIHNAEQAVITIRDQSRASLTEVRGGLEQMNKRSDQLRRDLVGIGNQVGQTAERAQQQIQQAAAGASEQIETRRQAAQDEAQTNYRRLDGLHRQIEQGAEQIRQNASRLLEQAQESTTSIRTHATEMLAQAQGGSDKIGEQAARLLMQAHTSAERFREQAETLLERAEATAEAIRTDVSTLRSDILEDSEQLRGQITNVKQEIVDTRQESVQAVNDAKCIQESARKKADELIARAGEIAAQTEQLLRLPKELVDEANRRAYGLADMCKKVSAVIKRLSAVNSDAQQNKGELDQAGQAADQKLELLKRHTARVGQLVGIIRQLYGTMDARLDRLRNRLSQADDICRGVPREIENLRQALGEETEEVLATAGGEDGARAEPQAAILSSTRLKPQSSESATDRQEARRVPAGSVARMSKGSLGEIVQRNQKLNEWLCDVLGEEQVRAATQTKAKRPARQKALSKP